MEDTAATASGSTATGPASFSDPGLTWSDAPPASTPTTDSTPAASASAETTPPPADGAAADGSPQQGEPPKERWNDILANARTKAAEEALAPVAWARDIPQQEFQKLQQIARHFAGGDVEQGLRGLLQELSQDPANAATLRSLHARELAALRQRTAETREPQEPQMVNVQLEDGSVVAMPRDPAAWLAHHEQQWMSKVQQQFQPVTETIETLRAREAAAQQQQQIEHFTTTTFQDVQTWPGMDSKESLAAVANELAKAQINPNDPREVTIALNAAWRKVIAPTLGKKAEATLLDSLKRNAAAATGINPGSAAASTPKSVTRFSDLPAEAWR